MVNAFGRLDRSEPLCRAEQVPACSVPLRLDVLVSQLLGMATCDAGHGEIFSAWDLRH